MGEVRFRRWSDGVELAVRSFADYEKYYNDGRHYITSGEHATHTPDGFPLEQAEEVPAVNKDDDDNTTEHVPTTSDDKNTRNKLSR